MDRHHAHAHQVVGVDLSPIQPEWYVTSLSQARLRLHLTSCIRVPANLEFQVDDAEQDWTFREDEFDFIHIRYMSSAISDWPRLLSQCRR